MPRPRFPVYIPSKSRAATALTPRALDELDVPYRLVVEAPQFAEYAAHFPPDRLLVLDPAYQAAYDTCDDLGDSKSKGPGPARNFIWEHSLAEGHAWHWVMDDNIKYFARTHRNQQIRLGDGTGFHAMEEFALRYLNLGMAGPAYLMFTKARQKLPPFIRNTRIYSCNLIRNDLRLRWRGRYNEDTDLSLRMLKSGWATVQFNAFVANKITTQAMAGGNTEEFYAREGTGPKSEMLVRLHPDVARLTWRFGRVHHYVDYGAFRSLRLVRRPDYVPSRDAVYRLRVEPHPEEARRV